MILQSLFGVVEVLFSLFQRVKRLPVNASP